MQSIGPEGTAICVYPAYNSRETDSTAIFNRGIFDIFREDLTMGTMERQNNFVECDPNGRSLADSDWIDIIQDVKQIGSNPLLVMDRITVTKMVVDSVCVVRSTDPNSCVNQDVLFLGTNTGKVIKVVFATVNENNRLTTDPVFAEEISLENRERVYALHLETVGSDNKIFVSTESQVYQLPIERCFRFKTCSTCVGSRDPYCVWNNNANACEKSALSAVNETSGTVPTGIWQDIHDGIVDNCITVPECSVTANVLGSGTFTCHARCNSGTASVTFSVSDNSLTSGNCPSTADQALNNGEACAMFSGGLGLHSYQCSVNTTRTDNTPGPMFTASVTTAPGPTCSKEAIRLVGGSTIREGRVEVCVDGRWGTVCNNSQEGIAEAVCSQLGFPAEGAVQVADTSQLFGGELLNAYTCTFGGDLNCFLSTDVNCDSAVGLGVMCRTHQEVIRESKTNQTINATCPDLRSTTSSVATLGSVVCVLLTVLVVFIIS